MPTDPSHASTHTLLVTKLLSNVARGACSVDCLYATEYGIAENAGHDDTGIGSEACVCECDGRFHGVGPLIDQARFVLPMVTGIIYDRR